jgi:hypothetical protein
MGQVECRAYGARTIGDLYGRRLKEQMGCFDPRFTMFARAAIAGARSPTQAKKNQKEGLNGAPNLLLPIIPPKSPLLVWRRVSLHPVEGSAAHRHVRAARDCNL